MSTSTLLCFSFIYHQTYSESLFTLAGPFQPQSDTIIGYSDVVDSMIIEFDMTFHSIVNSWGGILSIGADYDERLPMILMQNNENWLNFNVATTTTWSDDSCDSWAPSNGRFTNGENYHLRFFFNQSACGYYINGTLIHANYQHDGHPIIGQRPIYIDTLPHSSPTLPADITIRNLVIWTPTVNAFVTLDPTPSPTPTPTFSTNAPTNAPVTEPPTTSGTTFPTNTPTTNNPTTNTPTTYNPTTSNPTTNTPTTYVPTTLNPTIIPTTVNPTNNPITYQPTTSIPTTDSLTTSIHTISGAPTVSPITPLPTSDPITLNPTTRIPTEAGESGEIDMDTTISDGKINKNVQMNSSNGMNVMFYIIGAAACCICILLMIVFIGIKKRKQHAQKDMCNNMKHSDYNNTINSRSPTSPNNSTFVTGFNSNATQISEEPQYFQNHLCSVIVGSGILMDDIIDEMDGNTHVTAGGPMETNDIDMNENKDGEGDSPDTMVNDDDDEEIIEMVNMVTPQGGEDNVNKEADNYTVPMSPMLIGSMSHQSDYNVMNQNDNYVLSPTKGNENIGSDEFIVEDEQHEQTTKGYIGNEDDIDI